MLETALSLPFWLEMAATLAGAIFGARAAVNAKYDILGTCCIAIVMGVSGGILRDVLLQNYGIYAFQHSSLILVCVVAGIAVFYFGHLFEKMDLIIDPLDNLSLALWAVIGTSKGISAGLDVIPAIILGTITANGGGIIRDIAMNREVEAFRAGTYYMSAALAGCIVYALMHTYHVLDDYAGITCVILILAIRYGARWFGWKTRPARDYSHVVTKPLEHMVEKVQPEQSSKANHANTQPSKLRTYVKRLNGQAPEEQNENKQR